MPFDKTYDAVLNFLKREGYTFESASKDIGQIITAMVITGGWRQTGTRVQITLIKDSKTQTTIRVAVTEQKRYKALTIEPWSEPKINPEVSAKIAQDIKAFLETVGTGK